MGKRALEGKQLEGPSVCHTDAQTVCIILKVPGSPGALLAKESQGVFESRWHHFREGAGKEVVASEMVQVSKDKG